MAVRARRFSILIAALAMAAVLVPVGNAAMRTAGQPALPTLYVEYTMNCTFSVVDDNLKPVTAIAPGTYQIEVETPTMFKLVRPGGVGVDNIADSDYTGCKGWVQFQMTGPGVNLFTTLDSGCDAFLVLPPQTFKPSSTYTLQDLNQPAVTRTAITVLATGTPPVPKSPYSATSGKGTLQQDLIGSQAAQTALKGTLAGSLSPAGKPTLTSKGKAVSIIKAGRYRFAINDQDPKASFTLQAVDGKPTDITASAFVGKHSRYVTLKAGRWMYFSDAKKAFYFRVT
jgi:hypothetical protein